MHGKNVMPQLLRPRASLLAVLVEDLEVAWWFILPCNMNTAARIRYYSCPRWPTRIPSQPFKTRPSGATISATLVEDLKVSLCIPNPIPISGKTVIVSIKGSNCLTNGLRIICPSYLTCSNSMHLLITTVGLGYSIKLLYPIIIGANLGIWVLL